MKHTRPFIDPVRPVFKGLSQEGQDAWERVFGPYVLPNEKDHLDSYVRIGDERILVGSANTPIAKEKPKPVSVPGEVHRIELPFMSPQMFKAAMKQSIEVNVGGELFPITELPRRSE